MGSGSRKEGAGRCSSHSLSEYLVSAGPGPGTLTTFVHFSLETSISLKQLESLLTDKGDRYLPGQAPELGDVFGFRRNAAVTLPR